MITQKELERLKEKVMNPGTAADDTPRAALSPEEALGLITEVENLKKFVTDHGNLVNRKLDALEGDLARFDAENERLRTVKEGLEVERNACIALLARMAAALGLKAGVCLISGENGQSHGHVAVDLPSGQVSWGFPDSEAHLFEGMASYDQPLVSADIEEKYTRVMNPGPLGPRLASL